MKREKSDLKSCSSEKKAACGRRENSPEGREGTDYRTYRLSATQTTAGLAIYILCALGISWLFYESIIPVVAALPFIPLVLHILKAKLAERRRRTLGTQFCDGMKAYSSALRAGYSAENGLAEAIKSISDMYGENALLARELKTVLSGLSVGKTVEAGLSDLGERSSIKDIQDMAEVFAIAKRSGGSLPDILKDTVYIMEEKVRIEAEINTMISGKKLEQRLMYVMPAGILIYIKLTSADFMSPLYEGADGRVIMTVFLGIYIGTVILGERLLKVRL